MKIITGIGIILLLIARIIQIQRHTKSSVPNQTLAQDQDQQIIDRLIKHGSNPDKEHQIEFAFYGEPAHMRTLVDEMSAQGYQYDAAQSIKDEEGSGQYLVMIKPCKLHLYELKVECSKMNAFSQQHGVAFDGWSTAIVR